MKSIKMLIIKFNMKYNFLKYYAYEIDKCTQIMKFGANFV